MTEGERAFYERRIREEFRKADAPENQDLRNLHLRWALLYQERLDGTPSSVIRPLDAHLREPGCLEPVALPPEQAEQRSAA